MQLSLEVPYGPGAGQRILLKPGQVTRFGRAERPEVFSTRDSYMSRVHFEVECGEGKCRVRDLKSQNGTYVNGKKVMEVEVSDGDSIVAGRTPFVIRIDEGDQEVSN